MSYPADFSDIVPLSTFRASGIELVEEIDAFRLIHRRENEPQFRCGLTHELGHQPIE